MRKGVGLLLALSCLALLIAVFLLFPGLGGLFETAPSSKEEMREDLKRVKRELQEGRPQEAMETIRKYDEVMTVETEEGRAWLDLLIQASEELPNPYQLMLLHHYFPDLFSRHEKATALIATSYLASGQLDRFQEIRTAWAGREKMKKRWLLIDADFLLAQGKSKEAVQLLESRSFEGSRDVERLERLALLLVNQDAERAWNLLDRAFQLDPEELEVRFYRARLLEAAGKEKEAHREYLAASYLDQEGGRAEDQLAEFYRRSGRYRQALSLWKEQLQEPSDGSIWLKAWFWSRTASPPALSWRDHPPPEGPLEPLLGYLNQLPEGSFWDDKGFEKILNASLYARQQQAVFWLRLLEALKRGEEETALALLRENPFKRVSWNPRLERALERMANWRLNGSLQLAGPGLETPVNPHQEEDIPLFQELEALARLKKGPLPEKMERLLSGENAFASAFLAAGWNEAALELKQGETLEKGLPSWVSKEFAEAVRSNRGDQEALAFVKKQYRTPELTLLAGELYASLGQPDRAVQLWKSLEGPLGEKAALLTASLYLEQDRLEEAAELIRSRNLARQVRGRELLARIALAEGEEERALQLYRGIQESSSEAKSFLARQAYLEGDFQLARELTEELLDDYPDNREVQQNLYQILHAERGDQA